MNYSEFPQMMIEDIVRLRRKTDKIPLKVSDSNLVIGTWNIRNFGSVYKNLNENHGSPKRNLRAMVYIAEIIKKFDVIAIQEVKSETVGIRLLVEYFLGPNWGLIMSDVSAGDKGNNERLAFIYDKRRVLPSGLAGEIVLPPTNQGDPNQQFDRTPYIVGFKAASEKFALLTAHIKYGSSPGERVNEIKSMAEYAATEIFARTKTGGEAENLIILGDFNIDDRSDNPLFQAFTSTGLFVPRQLWNLKTTFATKPKFYDQIAWFMGGMNLDMRAAGTVDFSQSVYKELTPTEMSFRVSDHLPLWVEFNLDRSMIQMAEVLANAQGVSPDTPTLFENVPD